MAEQTKYEKDQEEARKLDQQQRDAAAQYDANQKRMLKEQDDKRRQEEKRQQDQKQLEKQQQEKQQQEKLQQTQRNLESAQKNQRSPAYQCIVENHAELAKRERERQAEIETKSRQPDHQRDVERPKLVNEASRLSQKAYEERMEQGKAQQEFAKKLENPELTATQKKHVELQRDVSALAHEKETSRKASYVSGIVGGEQDKNKERFAQEHETLSKEHDKKAKELNNFERENGLGKYALEQKKDQQKGQDKAQSQMIPENQAKTPDQSKQADKTPAAQTKQPEQAMSEAERRVRERQDKASAKGKTVEITPEMQQRAEKCEKTMDDAKASREQSREREQHQQKERER